MEKTNFETNLQNNEETNFYLVNKEKKLLLQVQIINEMGESVTLDIQPSYQQEIFFRGLNKNQ